ncbi:MAG: ribosome biogenesis factor YjgA [Oceanococcus sp.]
MNDEAESDIEEISKSQAKREDAQMQELGRRLVGLSKVKIESLPVSDSLCAALLEFKRIPSREAQRRHIKRVGRLLREHDVAEVSLALDRVDPSSSLSMHATKSAQRWCERLMEDGKPVLTELVERYPDLPVQSLGQLLRKVTAELKKQESGVAAKKVTPSQKEMLRLLRQSIVQSQ